MTLIACSHMRGGFPQHDDENSSGSQLRKHCRRQCGAAKRAALAEIPNRTPLVSAFLSALPSRAQELRCGSQSKLRASWPNLKILESDFRLSTTAPDCISRVVTRKGRLELANAIAHHRITLGESVISRVCLACEACLSSVRQQDRVRTRENILRSDQHFSGVSWQNQGSH